MYDMAMEVDILAKFSPEWAEAAEKEAKWADKKAKLEEVINACDVPKLKPGDFKHLVELFKKFLKDSNVVVAQYAAKAYGALGKGLRESFEAPAKEAFALFIPKLKDRKMIPSIQEAFDNFTFCFDLPSCMEQIMGALKDPKMTPAMRKCVVEFVDRFVLKTYIDPLREI